MWNGYKIDYILGHKKTLNKFLKIQVIQRLFLGHNGMKLEINERKTSGKHPNISKLLNNPRVNTEMKWEIIKYF